MLTILYLKKFPAFLKMDIFCFWMKLFIQWKQICVSPFIGKLNTQIQIDYSAYKCFCWELFWLDKMAALPQCSNAQSKPLFKCICPVSVAQIALSLRPPTDSLNLPIDDFSLLFIFSHRRSRVLWSQVAGVWSTFPEGLKADLGGESPKPIQRWKWCWHSSM